MNNKVLIFRTDRIGDLIFTCPAILAIKSNLENCEITLIASEKNYAYALSLNIFDNVLQFPKSNIIKKLKFIYNLLGKKFSYVFIFDGKERSIISTALIKSKCKVAITPKIKQYYN